MPNDNELPPVEDLGPLGNFLTDVVETVRHLSRVPGSHTFNFHLKVRDVITMTDKSNISTIDIHGSNKGPITVVQDSENVRITNNIGRLNEKEETKSIANALEDFQKGINEAHNVEKKEKTDLLQAVDTLSDQATKEENERTSWSVSAALGHIKSAFTAASALSVLWDKWGDTVTSFFSNNSSS